MLGEASEKASTYTAREQDATVKKPEKDATTTRLRRLPQPGPSFVQRLMWGLLVVSIVSLAAITVYAQKGASAFEIEEGSFYATLINICSALALVQGLATFGIREVGKRQAFSHKKVLTPEERTNLLLTVSIFTWLLIAAIAVYGLIVGLLTHKVILGILFFAAALVLMLIHRPSSFFPRTNVPHDRLPR